MHLLSFRIHRKLSFWMRMPVFPFSGELIPKIILFYQMMQAFLFLHHSKGLRSFDNPLNKLKSVPRVDSRGEICGASYKVDDKTKKASGVPRVGNAAD
ncbi:hypothetical protein HPP92_003191 [Vanilla planifolia]|uniref:DUF3700 domain-containing protein n=1 Tax=Vanilla planifolia TaxID=51239 RepID=A0A835S2S9_VANPL|nr:hypothetical protein HPP92_003191 [Vanilla planifolia]